MQEARTFLESLFGDAPSNMYLLAWTLPDRMSRWYQDVKQLSDALPALRDAHDVYIGVGLSPRDFGPERRCRADQIAGIVGLWADMDYSSPVHAKPNLPPDEATARELLDSMGLAPSLVIHSGNGLQAWWLFKEPWIFENAEERNAAAALATGWNRTLRARAKQKGYDADSLGDLSRILRLPGTFNHKSDPPKPVRLLEAYADRRYNIPDFEQYLIDFDDRTTTSKTTTQTAEVGPLILNANATPPFDKFMPLIENDPRIKRTWNRQRTDLQDQSASSYDMSLASFAASASWSDQEIVNLLIAHRRLHGDDLKLRQDYYARTISRAREPLQREQETTEALEVLESAVEQMALVPTPAPAPAPAQEDDAGNEERIKGDAENPSEPDAKTLERAAKRDEARVRILDAVSKMLTVNITRFVKYTSDPPLFRLETEGKAIMLGGGSAITSQHSFKTAVYTATGKAIPKFKGPQWDQIIEALAKAAVEEGIGEEATERGTAKSWLYLYLGERRPIDDANAAAETGSPFHRDGELYIFGTDLRRWLNIALGERITPQAMGTILRAYGCTPQVTFVQIGDKGERRSTSRSTWKIPPEIADGDH